MYKKLLFCSIILFVVLLQIKSLSFAQDEIPEDVIVGGKAKCVINGRTPFRRFLADGNRLLILQSGDFSKASFSIQSIFENKKQSNDVNILALLGPLASVEGFLGGKALVFENLDSDLEIKTINKSSGETIEIKNQDEEGVKTSLLGRIKIISSQGGTVSGITRLNFQETFTLEETNSNLEDNGRVIIICRFKDVPIAIKELAF